MSSTGWPPAIDLPKFRLTWPYQTITMGPSSVSPYFYFNLSLNNWFVKGHTDIDVIYVILSDSISFYINYDNDYLKFNFFKINLSIIFLIWYTCQSGMKGNKSWIWTSKFWMNGCQTLFIACSKNLCHILLWTRKHKFFVKYIFVNVKIFVI